MLFPYTYVPHQMEKMQEFIDFIFTEVWCNAPNGLVFHPDLFQGNPDLQQVISEFGFSQKAPVRGKLFYEDVKSIYEHFALLTAQEIDQFKKWYQGNNDIEKVCANDPAAQLVRYVDIPSAHETLCNQLASFFQGLYSSSLLELAALKAKIGGINECYLAFVQTNDEGKCPFCGIADLLGEHHRPKREAFDHYLPKSLYPFNSINLRNLVPTCHHCNSSYKTVKDPAHESTDPPHAAARRKVFYPYRTDAPKIVVSVSLAHPDIDTLKSEEISFKFGPAALSEELNTWRDVYGIDVRYRAKLLGKNDGKYWLEQALGECSNLGKKPADVVAAVNQLAAVKPFAECNFLRSAFVQACYQAGTLA